MIRSITRTKWRFRRWLILAIGVYLVLVVAAEPDPLAASMGGLLAFLALFNLGCGALGCKFPPN